MTRLAAGVAVAVLWPAAASAYRPFDGTDAAVARRGEVEVELGPVGWLRREGERSLAAPSLVLNWGFADRCEAVIEGTQRVVLAGDAGRARYRLEDAALDLKTVLHPGSLQGREGPGLAAEVGALLPEIHGQAGMGARAGLIASQRWRPVTVHLGLELSWSRADAPGAAGGLIAEGPEAWPVRPVAELRGEAQRGAPTRRSGLLGAICRVREGLSLDAAVRVGRAGRALETEVRAGLTWAFPAP